MPDKALARARCKRRVVADVVAAEARLDTGTFEVCEACGRAIALERLRASPTTR